MILKLGKPAKQGVNNKIRCALYITYILVHIFIYLFHQSIRVWNEIIRVQQSCSPYTVI